jgi:hypothetical protein
VVDTKGVTREVSIPIFVLSRLGSLLRLFNIICQLHHGLIFCVSAFRDRNAGSASNRGKPTGEDGGQDRRAHGTYDGRGRGRGGRGGGRSFDRHSNSVGG